MSYYDGGSMRGSGEDIRTLEVFVGCDRCLGETYAEVEVEYPAYEAEVECEHCGYVNTADLEV